MKRGPTINLERGAGYREEQAMPGQGAPQQQGQVMPMGSGNLPMVASASVHAVVTAQAIPQWARRDEEQILVKLSALCAQNGDKYAYEWDINDRANRRKTHIFDLSVKATNDLVRVWGNCMVDIPLVVPDDEGWTFYARFIDYETGYTLVRPFFQSRKRKGGQDTDDSARRMEGLYAMGVSKAERNVVRNALGTQCEHMKEELQKGVLAYITKNPEKIQNYIDKMLDEHDISEVQLNAVVGRPRKDWTHRNIAQAVYLLRAIDEGFTTVEEALPSKADAPKVQAEKDAGAQAEEARRDERTAEKTGGEGAPGRARSTPSPEDGAAGSADKAAQQGAKPAAAETSDDRGSSGTGQPAPGAGAEGGIGPASDQGAKINTAADALEKGAAEPKEKPKPQEAAKEPEKAKPAPAAAAAPAKAKEAPADDSKPWWE